MDSKKVLRGRNANLPRKSDFTREFEKDWRSLQHRGINLADLKGLMTLLVANEGPLPPEWKDHPLKGPWTGHRECHAGGDLLLIYKLRDDNSIVFVRTGTHADLFE
jgi:mRNA interferase YafQ